MRLLEAPWSSINSVFYSLSSFSLFFFFIINFIRQNNCCLKNCIIERHLRHSKSTNKSTGPKGQCGPGARAPLLQAACPDTRTPTLSLLGDGRKRGSCRRTNTDPSTAEQAVRVTMVMCILARPIGRQPLLGAQGNPFFIPFKCSSSFLHTPDTAE